MVSQPSERTLVFLVGAVQFVNVLDFMMVMPLGPDFAAALQIPLSDMGLIGGSYTAAAGVSGLVGSLFLDRFDRRKALAVAMAGLVVATAMGALAVGLGSLLAARVLAGIFGGPATSVALSIIADVVPVQRRGKAIGAVMSAFSVASVLGVPAGLMLAEHGGWQSPFLAVAGLGAVVTLGAILMLPPLRIHLESGEQRPRSSSWSLITRPLPLQSYVMTMLTFAGGFTLIPNISPYVLKNLHYPRTEFEILYLAGGIVSFLALRSGGILVDRWGPLSTGIMGNGALACVLYVGFINHQPWLPVVGIFMWFMLLLGIVSIMMIPPLCLFGARIYWLTVHHMCVCVCVCCVA